MITIGEHTYSIDGYMKQVLDQAKKLVKEDWDMIFLYDGYEGSGKSVKAMLDAYYCDPTLNLSRVTFTSEEFRNAVLKAEPYEAVIYDEAYTGLSSRSTMTTINKSLVKMLAEIRQKKLFVFIVMPTFFDLDKYVALWRSRFLVHVYTSPDHKRGFFRFYRRDSKKNLYVLGKKFYNYDLVKSNFYGKFPNYYIVNEKAYRKKKLDALTLQPDHADNDQMSNSIFLKRMFARVQNNEKVADWKHEEKKTVLGIGESTYWRYLKSMKEGDPDFSY